MLEKAKGQPMHANNWKCQTRAVHKLKSIFLLASFCLTSITFFFVVFVSCIAVNTVSAAYVSNSCIQCHSKPDFLITDKKLYKYFRDWELSIHSTAEVTCVDCHGGNPSKAEKREAHGKDIQLLLTPVEYERISATCGKCHKENAENYKKSKHYRILTGKNRSSLTPVCVTCHGSINTSIPKPDDIANICGSCHNAITENNPENPEIASELIKRLYFLNYLIRYLISKGVLEENPQFSVTIDQEFSDLAQIWHTLELDRIEQKTRQIRAMLMKKRDELKVTR